MTVRVPLAVAAAVVLVDQVTKHWAVNALADDRTIDLVGSLRFNLAFNKGMAFSQGLGFGPLIAVVGLVVIVVLLVSVGRATSPLYPAAVGLIVGGAVGNIIDRLLRGEGWLRGGVVDFIDLQWWPIFNVADMCVTVGGALLLLSTIHGARPAPSSSSPTASDVTGDASADEADEPDPVER
ncbi:MAG: signal peptidase II [Actinomycetota bacterium]|nr:signal peptidase II [Acidimicrobiia bacterium]MDQ3469231.1 signal peptidase II [Actinomycetota bacterium]